jgi:imidazolonepropionase-like amidohydrolase
MCACDTLIPERGLMTLRSTTKSAAWAATLFTAAIAFAASDARAQPHINVTQGQPLAGCSGRIDNLKPPAMNWANQNPIDLNKIHVLRAARILEPRTGEIVRGGYLVVRGACILGVNIRMPDASEVVDLGDVTLLPGLVDLHTHLLLRDEDQTWPYSILWKTTPYRIIEGLDAAIKTLHIGFTTVRDLDNEGAMFGDTALRDAIARGVFPGPRMLVAGQPLTITGGDMNLPLINPEIRDRIPQPADMADNRDAMIAFTRKAITNGSDWVKIYGTSTRRQTDPVTMEPFEQFTKEDVRAIVDEARRYKRDVAAHVYGGPGAEAVILGGVRTVEHGPLMTEENLRLLVKSATYWVPTLSTYYKRQTTDFEKRLVEHHKEAFQRALKMGAKIAFGTDVGSFPHGTQNDEFALMVQYGMTRLDALRSATSVAAEALRMDGIIGTLRAGSNADVIAVQGDPTTDIADIKKVAFVMANGRIVKNRVTSHRFPWEWDR